MGIFISLKVIILSTTIALLQKSETYTGLEPNICNGI